MIFHHDSLITNKTAEGSLKAKQTINTAEKTNNR